MSDDQASQSGGVGFRNVGSANVGGSVVGRDYKPITVNVEGVDPSVLRAIEDRLNQFLDSFLALRQHLYEWKELHNLLQDLQIQFAACRGYAIELGHRERPADRPLARLFGPARPKLDEVTAKSLYEFSINWQACKRALDKLRRSILDLKYIGDDLPAGSPNRPDAWLAALAQLQDQMDGALQDDDTHNLSDLIGAFAQQVDEALYLADKRLRDVAEAINQLPHQIRLT
jgi:hypothetical protein